MIPPTSGIKAHPTRSSGMKITIHSAAPCRGKVKDLLKEERTGDSSGISSLAAARRADGRAPVPDSEGSPASLRPVFLLNPHSMHITASSSMGCPQAGQVLSSGVGDGMMIDVPQAGHLAWLPACSFSTSSAWPHVHSKAIDITYLVTSVWSCTANITTTFPKKARKTFCHNGSVTGGGEQSQSPLIPLY